MYLSLSGVTSPCLICAFISSCSNSIKHFIQLLSKHATQNSKQTSKNKNSSVFLRLAALLQKHIEISDLFWMSNCVKLGSSIDCFQRTSLISSRHPPRKYCFYIMSAHGDRVYGKKDLRWGFYYSKLLFMHIFRFHDDLSAFPWGKNDSPPHSKKEETSSEKQIAQLLKQRLNNPVQIPTYTI